jgi:hypothetical protein
MNIGKFTALFSLLLALAVEISLRISLRRVPSSDRLATRGPAEEPEHVCHRYSVIVDLACWRDNATLKRLTLSLFDLSSSRTLVASLYSAVALSDKGERLRLFSPIAWETFPLTQIILCATPQIIIPARHTVPPSPACSVPDE